MELRNLYQMGLVIIVAIVILEVGASIAGNMQTAIKDKTVVTNETTTAFTSQTQAKTLTHGDWVVGYNETVYMDNTSSIEGGSKFSAKLTRDVNYTVSSTASGQITGKYLRNASNSQPDANGYYIFRVTYRYYKTNDASNIVGSGVSALGNFADWLPIIVIAVVAVVVLGLIVGGLGGGFGGVGSRE